MESWDAIWRDWELIHSIDPQGTYTGSDLGFIQELNSAVGSIGVQQLGNAIHTQDLHWISKNSTLLSLNPIDFSEAFVLMLTYEHRHWNADN